MLVFGRVLANCRMQSRVFSFFFWLLALVFWVQADSQNGFIPGQSYFGTNQYVEYIAGNLPVIVSAPHGGYIEPDSIPDRTCNNPTLVRDSRTQELARKTDSSFYDIFGCHPHVIICRMARTKLDCNRDIQDGACGNAEAEISWTEYQAFIDSAKLAVISQYGKGFFIDLHGHGHTIQRLELGYLLSGSELQLNDSTLDSLQWINQSSFRNLANTNLQGLSHSELLRGPQSLGTLFRQRGFPAVPSDTISYPQTGEPYFSGGYNTSAHSSYNGGTIDGLQIEINMDSVRDSDSHLEKFSDSLTNVIHDFLQLHIFTQQELLNCGIQTDRVESNFYPFRVYPNPFSDKLNFQNPEGAIIRMWDITGKLIFEQTDSNILKLEIQTGELHSGIYFIEEMSRKQNKWVKVIKY